MSKAARPTLGLPGKSVAEMLDAAPAPAAAPAPEPVNDDAPARRASEPAKPVQITDNPRNDALARLAEAAAQETGNDGSIPLDERSHLERPAADDDIPEDPADPYMPVAKPDDPAPAAPAAAAEVPAAKLLKVDVKGQVVEVPEDKVLEAGLHALRHHGAAEMALREANALLAQARDIAGQQPKPAPAADKSAPASTPEDALALAEAIQFGTKEDAAKAVAAMMQRGVAAPDINEVVARTVETRVRDVLDQDTAAKKLESLVPEMLTDRRVLALMAQEERAARAAGDSRPYTVLYPEIGQKIRGWLDSLKGPQQPAAAPTGAAAAADPIAARKAAKAATPAPVAGSGAAPAAPAQPKPPTGSEIVAQMRASRGVRTYI